MHALFLLSNLVHAEVKPAEKSPFTFGYVINVRPDFRFNPDFNSDTEDSFWKSPQTIRLVSEGKWKDLKIHASFQDVRSWGAESSPVINRDNLTGLYEGYFQLGSVNDKKPGFWARVGRQEMRMYDGLMLWNKPWNPFGATFNGVRLHHNSKRVSIDAAGFVLKNMAYYETTCSDDPNTEEDECFEFAPSTYSSFGDFLTSVHVELRLSPKAHVIPYYLGLDQGYLADDPDRDRQVYSPGLRVQGKVNSNVKYAVEGSYQFGRNGDLDHNAWMAHANVTYSTGMVSTKLLFEERSGDGDASDDQDNNFEGFFPASHKERGIGDFIGNTNVRDMAASIRIKPHKKYQAHVDYHFFQLSNPQGSWFAFPGGAPAAAPEGNEDATLGSEIDVGLRWAPQKGVSLRFTESIFIPMGAGKEIRGPDVSSATYLWMRLTK